MQHIAWSLTNTNNNPITDSLILTKLFIASPATSKISPSSSYNNNSNNNSNNNNKINNLFVALNKYKNSYYVHFICKFSCLFSGFRLTDQPLLLKLVRMIRRYILIWLFIRKRDIYICCIKMESRNRCIWKLYKYKRHPVLLQTTIILGR